MSCFLCSGDQDVCIYVSFDGENCFGKMMIRLGLADQTHSTECPLLGYTKDDEAQMKLLEKKLKG